MSGRLNGADPGIELLERSVDVVGIEIDGRGKPAVAVDLDDTGLVSTDLTGWRATHRGANANERKALPAGRDDGRRKALESELGHCSHIRHMNRTTAVDTGVDNPTAI